MRIIGNDGRQYETLAEAEKADRELEAAKAAAEAKARQLREEKDIRIAEINEAREHYFELLHNFAKDYGDTDIEGPFMNLWKIFSI